MKYLLLITTTILVSCSNNEPEDVATQENTQNLTDTLQNPETKSPISSSSPDTISSAGLGRIATKWHKIINQDEEFIIYDYCDAGHPWVDLFQENGQWKFSVFYGQEAILFSIENYTYTEEPFKDETEYYYRFNVKDDMGNPSKVVLNYSPVSGEVSSWSGFFNDDGPVLFIPEKDKHLFPVVEQPCVECWGEECDDMEG